MDNDMKRVTYRCLSCGAEMVVKFFPSESVVGAFGCQNCKAGFGMPVDQQLNSRVGMFPVEIVNPGDGPPEPDADSGRMYAMKRGKK